MPIADDPSQWENIKPDPKYGGGKELRQGARLILSEHSVEDYRKLRAALWYAYRETSSRSIERVTGEALKSTPPDGAPE